MKAIIVNRVSSKKQDPTLQLRDETEFCNKKNFEMFKTLSETASAGKSKQQQIFEAKNLAISLSKNKEDCCIVVWKYDRSFRNKKDFVNFMFELYELYGIKVFSVQEEWVNMLWELTETLDYSKIPEPYDIMMKEQFKLLWKNMVRIVGKMAEQEIKDKGARVKNAVIKEEGEFTKSYKGNKWGRKALSKNVISLVLRLHAEGNSIRQIAKQVTYTDKNKHLKNISIAGVHKILKENHSINKVAKEDVNLLNN